MNKLAVLLQAAEFLERRDRDQEHGYATMLPMPETYSSGNSPYTKYQKSRRSKSKLLSNRTTHNELEKNRRAHLRTCLERLKEKVPLGPDGARHTTLGLLKKAREYIQDLEDVDQKHNSQKDVLERDRLYLQRKLDMLQGLLKPDYSMKRRSVSESSGLSTESSSSSSSSSSSASLSLTLDCSDDVDILGYGSNQSDSDDHCSVNSSGSDGGVTVFTRRLTLSDTSPVPPYAQSVL